MARIDELKAQLHTTVQRVYSQPRDMSPAAIQKRIEERVAKAEASRGSTISAPPTNSSDG